MRVVLSLVMNPGTSEEQTLILAPGTSTIGRTKENQIVCMHKSLSRKHAQLDYDGTKVRVADLQSKNGLYFDGKRVATCELVEGDSFRADRPRLWSPRALPASITRPLQRGPFAVHPDGERVALFVPSEAVAGTRDKVVLVLDFFDQLRRLPRAATR